MRQSGDEFHGEDAASVLRRVLTREGAMMPDTTPSGAKMPPLLLTPALRVDPTPDRAERTVDAAIRKQPGENAALHRDEGLPGTDLAPTTTDIPEQIIDEAMLYALVGDIVREELRGEMGEKLTHNIRKLVRAELARELHLRHGTRQSSSG
ncbi:MAG: hypothetical protein ACXIUW_03715 [Roseinatronobacter sp.]